MVTVVTLILRYWISALRLITALPFLLCLFKFFVRDREYLLSIFCCITGHDSEHLKFRVCQAFVLLRQCWSAHKSEIGTSTEDSKSTKIRPNFWRSLALDFLVIVMPTVACLTVNNYAAPSYLPLISVENEPWERDCELATSAEFWITWLGCDAAGFSGLGVHHLGRCVRATGCSSKFSKVSIVHISILSFGIQDFDLHLHQLSLMLWDVIQTYLKAAVIIYRWNSSGEGTRSITKDLSFILSICNGTSQTRIR